MSSRGVAALSEALEEVIQRHIQAFHLTCAEVIGTMQIVLADQIRTIQDFEDPEEREQV